MVFIYFVLVICLLVGIWFLIPAYTLPIKDARGLPIKRSIASIEKVKLGGSEQWMLIRGENIQNPIILFLHGGPGSADMALIRKHKQELEKYFTVVTWDQRGAGKSYTARQPSTNMTISHFGSDTHELTEILRQRFNQKKIYLVGHSWGSVLGILTVQKYPDLYYAYIGIGQVANMVEGEQLSYDWTLAQAIKANDNRAVQTLTEMGRPPYAGDWQKKTIAERRLLEKYGGEVYGNSSGVLPLVLGSLISATEYTLLDKVNFFRGLLGSMQLLWQELMTINLMKQAPNLKVPVYFLLGKYDYEVPNSLAEQYFKDLEAPSKTLIWFENSAHFPNIEEKDKFNEVLINQILPATYI